MINRDIIYSMFDGRCAYCGKMLDKHWHVDHVAPIYRGWNNKPDHAGEDRPDNLFPACPRCNLRKTVLSVEDFRREIVAQVERLRRDSAAFRLAEDFGLVRAMGYPVVFWFEKDEAVKEE